MPALREVLYVRVSIDVKEAMEMVAGNYNVSMAAVAERGLVYYLEREHGFVRDRPGVLP